ncbi:MAG: methyltransferase domain-containing protein [Clostridia bacterium]
MIKARCPNCKKPLLLNGKSLVCESGHSFDISSDGYTNLLLSNMKNSKNPGDNSLMVRARFDFLNKGYYDFLSKAITEIVLSFNLKNITLLDAGCGSGYYLQNLIKYASNIDADGVDISKEAVKLASRRDKTSNYYVSSVFDLPYSDDVFDVIMCVFSPYAFSEYKRILKPNGKLIVVYPAEKHLIEIKKTLYGDCAFENNKEIESVFFNKESHNEIKKVIEFKDNIDLIELVKMTPYFYTTEAEGIKKLNDIEKLNLTCSFYIDVFSVKKC